MAHTYWQSVFRDIYGGVLGCSDKKWQNEKGKLERKVQTPPTWPITAWCGFNYWIVGFRKLQKFSNKASTPSVLICTGTVCSRSIALHHPDNNRTSQRSCFFVELLSSCFSAICSFVSERWDQWCDWLRVYLLITTTSDLYSTSLLHFTLLHIHEPK